MTDDAKEIIRHRLHRAEDALAEAAYLLQGKYINSTASRCYYACFYAVSALLLTKNLSSKTHKGIRILLNEHVITSGLMPISAMKFYARLFAFRQEGDYEDFPDISAETASELIAQAKEFVKEASLLTLQAIE